MIEFRPNGLLAVDIDRVVGRVVMCAGMTVFQEYGRPSRVLSVSGKSLQVWELKGHVDREINRKIYTDELNTDFGEGVPLQMRTVKLICDTAEEVNALRRLQEVIGDEYTAFMKAIPVRFHEMAHEMALKCLPKGP